MVHSIQPTDIFMFWPYDTALLSTSEAVPETAAATAIDIIVIIVVVVSNAGQDVIHEVVHHLVSKTVGFHGWGGGVTAAVAVTSITIGYGRIEMEQMTTAYDTGGILGIVVVVSGGVSLQDCHTIGIWSCRSPVR